VIVRFRNDKHNTEAHATVLKVPHELTPGQQIAVQQVLCTTPRCLCGIATSAEDLKTGRPLMLARGRHGRLWIDRE